MNINIKDIIKDNTVNFSHLKKGIAYYTISFENKNYIFPVSLEDIGDGTLYNSDRAIYFMRYIRKSLDDKTFMIES